MNFIDHVFDTPQQSVITEESYRILYHIYEKIINYKQIKVAVNNTYQKVDELQHFEFIPSYIRTSIRSSKLMSKSVIFNLPSNREIQIVVFHDETENLKSISELCERMYIWLSFIDNNSVTNCSKTLKIYLFLIDQEKVLPATGEEINTINANTAFTFSNKIDNEIYIYRK